MLFPLGLVESPRKRMPIVSIVIGAICIAVLIADDSVNGDMTGRPITLSPEFHKYWDEHPYLILPPEVSSRVDGGERESHFVRAKEIIINGRLPDKKTLEKEQAQLESLLLSAVINPWHSAYGLVPANGVLQVGWISSLFLHGGALHLIGNAIFFLVCGPVLEKLLTPLVFLGFYLVGGMAGGAVQVLTNPDSVVPIIGASGAIAACMGAFTVRFATDHIRLLYFPFMAPKIVEWPTWTWTALWAIGQVGQLVMGGASAGGVAIGAHLGSLAFGLAVGAALRVSGWGDRLEEKAAMAHPEAPSSASFNPMERAEGLLAEGHDLAAFDAFREILRNDPSSLPGQWGLARALFRMGEKDEGSRVFDVVLARWLQNGATLLAQQAVKLIANDLDPSVLRHEQAAFVAPLLERIDPAKAQIAHSMARPREAV